MINNNKKILDKSIKVEESHVQTGNAVPPLIAKSIALAIKKYL